jgi:Holliday junction resolvase RusA-like endonuclease
MRFTIYGTPQPAGSKRGFVNKRTGSVIITDDAKRSRPWKQEVAGVAIAEMGERLPYEGPVVLKVAFWLTRPKGHLRTNGLVKPSAPQFPAVRPDATKLLRAVEDALTGIVWRDDAQVVTQEVRKLYAINGRECCDVEVYPA